MTAREYACIPHLIIPGVAPVTDDPNPGGTQGSDPLGPGTDTDIPGEAQAAGSRAEPKPTERKTGS